MTITVRRKKVRFGLIYGLVAGLAFSVFAWGVDAVLLATANGEYFGVKFVPGLIICSLVGGLIGWLTMLIHKHVISILMWSLVAVLYSWLTVWLPFTASARLISLVNPALTGLLHYVPIAGLGQFRTIGLLVIGTVAIIVGLLEINLVDQAIMSSYLSGTVVALMVCFILFGIAGSATDHMTNANLREPVQVIHTLLQFARDHAGVDVPKTTAREMHLSATRQLGDLIQKPHRLMLIGFDENLLIVDVLANFNGTLVKCSTIYAQPTDCISLPSNP